MSTKFVLRTLCFDEGKSIDEIDQGTPAYQLRSLKN